jgi:flagellar motility protein MotE (MotC chaperone)
MRVRLLPLVMFALVGGVTVKIGAVWNGLEVSIGTETLAQAQPATSTPPAAATQPAATTQPPAAQPAQQPAAAGATAPTAHAPQEAAMTPPPGPPDSSAEQPNGEAAAANPDQPVHDPFDYTDEEVDVLQQLAKRREELDLRARQLDEREALIQAAEQRMDQKMAELKALQATVEDLLKTRSEQEESELKSLVKMYENMKPKAAARVFEEMDMDVLLDVIDRMNERKVAPILALVTPTRAKEITFELAQRRQLPMPE